MFDPDGARRPGAPLLHGDKAADARIADASRNLVAEVHGGVGDIDAGVGGGDGRRRRGGAGRLHHAARAARAPGDPRVHRMARRGRPLVMRTSSQVPFLVRDELCHVFGLDRDEVQVFTRRVGGGFGGKQEMLTEDLVALAVLRLGRPVRYEFSRADEFTLAPCRHPFRVDVTVAAGADGVLTALAVDVLIDAGAYGNHSTGRDVPRLRANRCRCTGARTSASTPRPSTPTTCRPARSAATASAR